MTARRPSPVAVKQTDAKPKKRVGDGTPGPGRKAGVPNKTTTQLKEAILEAAAKAGGKEGLVGYLYTQAIGSPSTFMPLLGKVLPLQVAGDPDAPINVIKRIELVAVYPETPE